MELVQFIPSELIIVVVATYITGMFFKKLETVKDKYIVVILMLFSIIFSLLVSKEYTSVAFLQGIICWGIAVSGNQVVKQLGKEE